MTKEVYMQTIVEKFKKYFKINEGTSVGEYHIDLHASHHNTYGRTFISKVDIIDQFTDREEHYIKTFESLDKQVGQGYIKMLEGHLTKGELPPHHRKTQCILTLVTETMDEKLRDYVRRYRFHKGHCLGIKGWTDIHIVYVTLDTKAVYTSKDAKPMQEVYTL